MIEHNIRSTPQEVLGSNNAQVTEAHHPNKVTSFLSSLLSVGKSFASSAKKLAQTVVDATSLISKPNRLAYTGILSLASLGSVLFSEPVNASEQIDQNVAARSLDRGLNKPFFPYLTNGEILQSIAVHPTFTEWSPEEGITLIATPGSYYYQTGFMEIEGFEFVGTFGSPEANGIIDVPSLEFNVFVWEIDGENTFVQGAKPKFRVELLNPYNQDNTVQAGGSVFPDPSTLVKTSSGDLARPSPGIFVGSSFYHVSTDIISVRDFETDAVLKPDVLKKKGRYAISLGVGHDAPEIGFMSLAFADFSKFSGNRGDYRPSLVSIVGLDVPGQVHPIEMARGLSDANDPARDTLPVALAFDLRVKRNEQQMINELAKQIHSNGALDIRVDNGEMSERVTLTLSLNDLDPDLTCATSFQVESSSDLNNWQEIGTMNSVGDENALVFKTDTGNRAGHYRVRLRSLTAETNR